VSLAGTITNAGNGGTNNGTPGHITISYTC
jgi:hypothetical protein